MTYSFSFCPDAHKLFRTMWTWASTILMEPCWPLCTNNVLIFCGWKYSSVFTDSSAPSTQEAANYRKLRGPKYNENCQRILTCIFEGITTLIYGITFNLTCSPQWQYPKWFEQHRHSWSPIIPKFNTELVSSPRTSQSSQASNSIPSPTTYVASNQSSQLEYL